MLLEQSVSLRPAERRIPGLNRSKGEKQEQSLEEMPTREQTAPHRALPLLSAL